MASTSNVKTADTRSSAFKLAVLAGIAFGVLFGGYFAIVESDLVGGVIIGAAGGTLYGIGMGSLLVWLAQRTTANRPALDGNSVAIEGAASHVNGVWTRGGWLFLTDSALYFKAHKLNTRRAPYSLPLKEIAEVKPSRMLGLIPNALTVITTSGAREKFSVTGRAAWVAAIRDAVRGRPATAP